MRDFLVANMDSKRYSDFYKTRFGREILKRENEFINRELFGCNTVLSIGCGPALHEAQIAISNPKITLIGLDISEDMLAQAPELPANLNLILGSAKQLCFKDESVDLVYFLTSLEFVNDLVKTLKETLRILKPNSRAIFIVANVESWYIQKELSEVDSYIKRKFENLDQERLTQSISKYLEITSVKLMLGIRNEEIFESEVP